MRNTSATLDNGTLKATILLPGCDYNRSRYDWGGIVQQVECNGHTFLSKEQYSTNVGLGGIGLANVFEWLNTDLHDSTAIADYFPLLGVGLLKRTDTAPFLFTRDYPVVPYEHEVEVTDSKVAIRTLPHLCCGVAVDMTKTYSLEGHTLTVAFDIKNVGPNPIHATEFCHNFFKFDDKQIDSSYRLSFPYTIEPKIRRGQVIAERDAFRLGEFDEPTASTAFWIRGWEGLSSHWMKLTNDEKNMSVLMEDSVPVCRFYCWNNAEAFCPEDFAPIDLNPGESISYTRKYTFHAE